jgi:hypothetical protein
MFFFYLVPVFQYILLAKRLNSLKSAAEMARSEINSRNTVQNKIAEREYNRQ